MFNPSAALNPEERDHFNNLRNKFQEITRKFANLLENTLNVGNRVELLKEVQTQHNELEAKFNDEMIALEAKYQKLYQPLYTKRYEIVNRVVDVEGDKSDKSAADQEGDEVDVEKGVADFWLIAMKNNKVLARQIKERDEGALKYLKDIKWSRIDEPKRFGFKLEFFFDTNPYFKNTVLTKIYHMIDGDRPALEKAIGTEIRWYPGNVLTQKFVDKIKMESMHMRPIIETENCSSFFNFFSPPQVPKDEYDYDEYEAFGPKEIFCAQKEMFLDLMDWDYKIGSTVRKKIIPHAVSWFTGEVAEEESELYVDEDDDDGEDEEGEIPPIVCGGWEICKKGHLFKHA